MKNKIKYFLITSSLALFVVFFIYYNKESKTNINLPAPNMFEDCDSLIDVYRSDLKVFRFAENLNTDSLINEIKIKMDPVLPNSKEKYYEMMSDPDFRIISDSTYNFFGEEIPYFNEIKNGVCRYKTFLNEDANLSKLFSNKINLIVYIDSDITYINQPNFTSPFIPIDFTVNPYDNSQWLLIGLHWFLGEDHAFYQSGQDFLRRRYDSIFLSSMVFNRLGYNYLSYNNMFNIDDDSFLAAMISEAKPYFFTKCMLPDVDDYRIFGFTKFTDLDGNVYDEMDFAITNESYFWKDIILKGDLLYSSNKDLKELYIIPGPAITCPSRLGVWIGYKILQSYYQNNQELTLREIMLESDYQKILNRSNYQP